MKYTGPKFRLCRREGINLFGTSKYDVRKRKKTPGVHGSSMPRQSEYAKLLRNKQALKRSYMITEKQFKDTLMDVAQRYSRNRGVAHDEAAIQFLERRLDSILLRAGFGNTIFQTRQMVTHGHFWLNGKKHNIPSYFVKVGDKITLRDKLKTSPLYTNLPLTSGNFKLPSWLNVNKNDLEIEVLDLPRVEEVTLSADMLKAIEFYARS